MNSAERVARAVRRNRFLRWHVSFDEATPPTKTELDDARVAIVAAEIAPPADVMEIARVVLGYTADPAWIINDPQRFPDVHAVARALTVYGDQRAREARAAAWAEAILMVDDETHITHNFPAPPIIAKMQERAHAAAPPQSEGGEG
jgi:hypothetical protein